MKTLTSHKYITAIIAIAVFALVFNGCKKADLKADTNTTGSSDLERAKAHAQQVSKEWGGLPEVFPMQQKMDVYWVDKNGVRKDPKVSVNSAGGCSNYDLPDYATLLQFQRTYFCGNASSPTPGYFIQFEYNVSWNKPVVPNNASTGTSTDGYISVYDDNGDVFVTDYTLTGSEVVINDLGTDPNNSANHIYNVKFKKSTVIPTAYLNGDPILNTTYTLRIGATFVTDCQLYYSLYAVPVKSFGFVGGTGLHPCDRNDRPIFQEPFIFPGQHKIGIAGYDPSFSCSEYGGSFIRTDLQQVQYSINGGANWFNFPNPTGSTNNGIMNQGFIRNFDFAESVPIAPGTYTVILRFKNWKYANGIPNPLITPPTAPPDCHSAGNPTLPTQAQRDYAEWAYEYWPLITI